MPMYSKENSKFDDGKGHIRCYGCNCVVCGDYFRSRSDRAKYCSQRCANDAQLTRRRKHMAEKREKHKNCIMCGKPLDNEENHWHRVRKYCSTACKQKYYRLLKKHRMDKR
ncbi:MAG: hypothetical protein RR224_10900 [Clostridia bacterium]